MRAGKRSQHGGRTHSKNAQNDHTGGRQAGRPRARETPQAGERNAPKRARRQTHLAHLLCERVADDIVKVLERALAADDQSDLSAEGLEDASELDSNVATANNHRLLGQVLWARGRAAACAVRPGARVRLQEVPSGCARATESVSKCRAEDRRAMEKEQRKKRIDPWPLGSGHTGGPARLRARLARLRGAAAARLGAGGAQLPQAQRTRPS